MLASTERYRDANMTVSNKYPPGLRTIAIARTESLAKLTITTNVSTIPNHPQRRKRKPADVIGLAQPTIPTGGTVAIAKAAAMRHSYPACAELHSNVQGKVRIAVAALHTIH